MEAFSNDYDWLEEKYYLSARQLDPWHKTVRSFLQIAKWFFLKEDWNFAKCVDECQAQKVKVFLSIIYIARFGGVKL